MMDLAASSSSLVVYLLFCVHHVELKKSPFKEYFTFADMFFVDPLAGNCVAGNMLNDPPL
jgi:hypothetical protein